MPAHVIKPTLTVAVGVEADVGVIVGNNMGVYVEDWIGVPGVLSVFVSMLVLVSVSVSVSSLCLVCFCLFVCAQAVEKK